MKVASVLLTLTIAAAVMQAVRGAQDPLLSTAFGNDMVLQAKGGSALYGWATPGSTKNIVVRVLHPNSTTSTEVYSTTSAASDGFWRLELPEREPSWETVTIDVTCKEDSTQTSISNVLFGDVFLCGGQSNMASILVRHADDGLAELLEAAPFTADGGAQLLTTECGSRSGQEWTMGTDGTLRVNGECLGTMKSEATMTTIGVTKSCDSSDENQIWSYDQATGHLIHKSTELCLQPFIVGWAYGRCNDTGPDLILSKCSSTALYQRWTYDNSKKRIINAVSAHCLTAVKDIGINNDDVDESIMSHLRIFSTDTATSENPLNTLSSIGIQWTKPTVSSLADFSAVCWFMGRRIAERVGTPVGLVHSAVSGTYIEAWSSPDALAECSCAEGNRTAAENHRSALWNAMIYPLHWMKIRGAVWYQGESNMNNPECYKCTFPAMIKDWRSKFDTNFPFVYVQIAPRKEVADVAGTPQIREAQKSALSLPYVAYADTSDLGDVNSPYNHEHPRIKKPIGYRLSLPMRHMCYGDTSITYYQGPQMSSCEKSSSNTYTITYTEDSVGSNGLALKTPVCPVDEEYCGSAPFELLDESSGNWVPADAVKVSQNAIKVTAPTATSVSSIRYLHAGWTVPIVFNSKGFPQAPFEP